MVTLLVNTNYAEDIYFFSANTSKCISSSVLKIPLSKKVNFYLFYSFWRLSVSRVTVFRTKRQRIVCDIIPGSIKLATLKKKKIIQRHNVRQVAS